MKALTVSTLLVIIFFVQVTLSHDRENTDLPFHEEEMESSVQSIHEDIRGDETDLDKSENENDVTYDDEEDENDDQDESVRVRRGKREEHNPKKRSGSRCPPGWLSPWDFAGNSNCDVGGCGGNCGGGGGFDGDGGFDNGYGCGECGCGGGCGCGGCGCGCGCKFNGGFTHHHGFGHRCPHLTHDGRINHVWLSKCEALLCSFENHIFDDKSF